MNEEFRAPRPAAWGTLMPEDRIPTLEEHIIYEQNAGVFMRYAENMVARLDPKAIFHYGFPPREPDNPEPDSDNTEGIWGCYITYPNTNEIRVLWVNPVIGTITW